MTHATPLPKLARDAEPLEDIPCYDARQLLGDSSQARILLDKQAYVLRLTRAGKLILTK